MKLDFQYTLLKSKRKTLSVEITDDGTVQVRAPRWTSTVEIEAFLAKNADWIAENRTKRLIEHVESLWTPGLTDEDLRRLTDEAREDIQKRIDRWAPIVAPDSAWAKEAARKQADAQLSFWDMEGDKVTKEKSPRLTIRHQKTLWGSCTSTGNLSFNCLLMLAPESVRDYIVVHELCHLKHLNHSPAFWKSVERVLPNYKAQKKWLKENGHRLLARLKT